MAIGREVGLCAGAGGAEDGEYARGDHGDCFHEASDVLWALCWQATSRAFLCHISDALSGALADNSVRESVARRHGDGRMISFFDE
jgi:hypothetical protein